MNITDIRMRRIENEGRMKAVASITLDNEFVIHDVKVIEGKNGFFIAMPNRKIPNGEFKDIVHPLNIEAREEIRQELLERYELLNLHDETEG